jgi:rod shape determining protein RodA
LGTALVVVALFLTLFFLSGAPLKLFGGLGIIAAIVITVVSVDTFRYIKYREGVADESIPSDTKFKPYTHLANYKFDRILVWVIPEKVDKLGEGWNSLQSKIAIGSGGFQGKGWTKGNVTRGGYLPRTVSLNDFIFAVFAEETGFVGGGILVGLYAILLWGGIKITMRARDQLGMLLAAGATFLLFFHTFVNMGMTIGILPIVGVPLPLMSYGGSFVLVCMISLGILQSVWLHRKPY